MRQGPIGYELVSEKGYPLLTPTNGGEPFDYPAWLRKVVGGVGARALVLDVRDDLPRAVIDRLREQGVLIVTLDDSSERRLAADLAFYPPVPQVERMDWTGFTGELHVGWDSVVLRREFADPPPRIDNERPVVLITMGGSDPAGLTLKAMEALDFLDEDFETIVLLGPGFSWHERLRDLQARTHRCFDVRQRVADVPGLMARADLAVAAFGVTAYELVAMRVPAVHLCLTEDHCESAAAFEAAGLAISLGLFTDVRTEALAGAVKRLLTDHRHHRRQMRDRATSLADGRGLERISRIIATRIQEADARREGVARP